MNIKNIIRFRPFCHLPGTQVLIPYSFFACRIFPTRIELYDYESIETKLLATFSLDCGKLEKFTVMQNLEQGFVEITGLSENGYFQAQIQYSQNELQCVFLKIPEHTQLKILFLADNWHFSTSSDPHQVSKGCKILLSTNKKNDIFLPNTRARLSLGSHKAQDIELILRRKDLTEILPLWFYLSQSVPGSTALPILFSDSQLRDINDAIKEKKKAELSKYLLHYFLSGFTSLLLPRLHDDSYQGFKNCIPKNCVTSPLSILHLAFPSLLALFFQENNDTYYILPSLVPEFHAGRLTDLLTRKKDVLHIEWTKKEIRRLLITAGSTREISFCFHPEIRRFRVRQHPSLQLIGNFRKKDRIFLNKKDSYLLDNFEK